MRLICGVLSFEGDIPGRDLVAPMCEAMQSPSRRAFVSIWADGPAALAVMDFGQGGPPTGLAIPRTGSLALAADIRLDNRDDLQGSFSLPGACDPRLTFAAIERWESGAPTHLLADFALAWIDRERHTLTLARDIFGIRPLAVHHQPGRHVVFASFARGIFPSGLVPREVDPLAIGRQIQFRFSAESTLFRNVRMLSPAHTVTYSRNGERSRHYWQPNLQPQRHKTPEAAADELRSLMDDAVRCRLPVTGPVAAHLSGGIDSSTICTFAARALRTQVHPRHLHGFSFWPAERPELNLEYERPFVESVLAQDPTIVSHPIPSETPCLWLTASSHPDRILSLSDDDPDNAVCRQAAALGADSVLSGWGGDEGATFNGRGVMAQSLFTFRWHYLTEEMNALRRTRGWSKRQVLAGEILPYVMPDALHQIKFRILHGQRKADKQWRDVLQPSVTAAIAADKDERSLSIGPSARQNQLALLRSGHLSWRATNWATLGARYGVGFTFPMLDRRVVELMLSVPAQWHLRGGFKRRLIRDATEGILPDAIRWRHNKIVPFPISLAEIQEQRDAILQRVRELANSPAVQAIFRTDQLLALAEAVPRREQAFLTPGAAATQTLIAIGCVVTCCNFLATNT